MTYQDCFEKIYDVPQYLGSFGGVVKLYKAIRKEGKYVLRKNMIRKWLETQETFGLHKQINKKFQKRRAITPYIDNQWDAVSFVMKS